MTEYRSAADLAAETKSFVDNRFREAKERADEALLKAGEATDALRALNERSGQLGTPMAETWGVQVKSAMEGAASGDFDALAQRRASSVRIEVKELTTAAGSAGALIQPDRDDVLLLPRRPLTVRALLTTINVRSNAVEYPRLTGRTNNAAPVAESALKPESDYTFDDVTVPIRTIAHWVRASRQALDDASQLQGIIDGELRYGLELVEETQLLNGSGTGQNLTGLVTAATAFVAPGGFTPSDANRIDTIAYALNRR